MATRSLSQTSLFDPRFAMPDILAPGSVAWVLAQHGNLIFPDWLASGWRGSGRRGRCTMAGGDGRPMGGRWAADGRPMGGPTGGPTPCERTMRDFETFLRELHRDSGITRGVLLHEHLFLICCEKGIADPAKWAADSSPMWCYRLEEQGCASRVTWVRLCVFAPLRAPSSFPPRDQGSVKGHRSRRPNPPARTVEGATPNAARASGKGTP